MGIKIKILSIVIGIIFFFFVLRSVKKNSLGPSYAVLWILISLFLISIPFLDFFYVWLAYSVIGINDARNIIYIAIIGFLLVYVFYLSIKISQMKDRIQKLISFTAVLDSRLNALKKD